MAVHDLGTTTTTDALVAALRERILDGDLVPGARLTERELVESYAVARHTVRVALRELAADGLVRIEPNRGASVAALDEPALRGLFDLRAALELESAHRMLERHEGRVAPGVTAAVARLSAVCGRRRPAWRPIVEAHEDVHLAIVTAAASPRIAEAYASVLAEERLFLVALRGVWTSERMAEVHERLVGELEREGPPALRRHLAEGEQAVLEAMRA